MKKLILLILLLLFPVFAVGADKQLQVSWQQELVDDLASWNIWKADEDTGPWTLVTSVDYTQGQTVFQVDITESFPDGQETPRYFSVSSVDTSGNESARSVAGIITIDFEAPPTPTTVIIIVVQ